MNKEKTTPSWIVELREKINAEKRAARPSKVPKTKPTRKAKKRLRNKLRKIPIPICLIPAAEPHVIEFAEKHRNSPTKGESYMHAILEESLPAYGIRFAAQVPIGKHIADFLIFDKRLVVEVDGEYHFFRGKQDYLRTKALNRLGYEVVRFTNHAVMTQAPQVRNEILQKCVGSHAIFHLD